MKSLVRSAKAKLTVPGNAGENLPITIVQQEEAQCCAKVSKTVAGCHD